MNLNLPFASPVAPLWGQLTGSTFLFPEQSSTVAPDVDWLFYFILWLSVIFFVIIVGLMLVFMFWFRRRPGVEPSPSPAHSTPLEVTWSVVPGILLVFVFYWGFTGYIDLRTPPSKSYKINVLGQQWSWAFTYPNGYTDSELHVPANQPVELVMASNDVIHSLFIPAFRVKQDVVPGRYTNLWFEAKPGTYDLFCAEYCGLDHSTMITKVVVHPTAEEFAQWLATSSDPFNNPKYEGRLDLIGESFYLKRGCAGCHSIDGKANTGPTFKGLFGREETLSDGSKVKVDENYIRESILNPTAKVVQGFRPVMPTYQGQLKDKEIGAIIEYLKTVQ